MCAKKNSIDTRSWKTTSLDAYSAGTNEKNLIQSISTPTLQTNNGRIDQIKQHNSIHYRHLKGKYDLKIEKNQNNRTIKIVLFIKHQINCKRLFQIHETAFFLEVNLFNFLLPSIIAPVPHLRLPAKPPMIAPVPFFLLMSQLLHAYPAQ
jgi:hypothetical protein